MKAFPHEIGQVVVSLRGHDRGRRFLIVGLIDERYALIADGDTRKLGHPKKKQLKHLRAEPVVAEAAIPDIEKRAQTADSALRKALKATAPGTQTAPSGALRITDKEEYALVQE